MTLNPSRISCRPARHQANNIGPEIIKMTVAPICLLRKIYQNVRCSGNVYVADYNNRIQKFTSTGTFVTKWGSYGSGDGQLYYPSGVVVNSNSDVYVSDSDNHRIQKFTWSSSGGGTNYTYDILGNLTQVKDNSNNTTTINYNWLSRKLTMSDPDMGNWSYTYYDNGNLYTQTDAKSQTITMVYDALNRLTNKNYPGGSGMTNVVYGYDSTSGGNYGKGKRTSMTDYFGTNSDNWKYDTWGRLIREDKIISSVTYTTQYTYDGADRIATITYPTNEVVTQTYNGRGLPYTLSGTTAGSLVSSVLYNQLGSIMEINLNNSTKSTLGYYGTGGTYDTTGGYYGRLWEIKTTKQPGGTPVLQDVKHTWDAGANLTQRQDLVSGETENFTYDPLDRLLTASGAYSEAFTYNEIGNITSKNGVSYAYGTKPHAVTAVGSTSYVYDSNGNMTTRGTQTLTWDVENKPLTVTGGNSYYYDGDGNRVKEIDGSTTTIYINKYYEKNITTSEITTHYYLGGKQIAVRKGSTVSYMLQDHLGSTSVIADTSGASTGIMRYFPFGLTRSTSGAIPTDEKFTGQRLDSTGLYYYGARYYDANIGRFISPDTIVPHPYNPQSLNRYSYALNNPLKYIDPSGHDELDWSDPNTAYYLWESQGAVFDPANVYNGVSDYWDPAWSYTAEPEVPIAPDQPIVPTQPEPSIPSFDVNDGSVTSSEDAPGGGGSSSWGQSKQPTSDSSSSSGAGEKLRKAGEVTLDCFIGGAEIISGLTEIGVGLLVAIGGTIESGGAAWWIAIPAGALLVSQGYSLVSGGILLISQETINLPRIPYMPPLKIPFGP